MIWTAGQIVADHELLIPATDRTFEHGLGLFETLRTWNGRAVLLDRHLARLQNSADALGLPFDRVPFPNAEAVAALLKADAREEDALLRITLTGGQDPSVGSTLWMRSAPLPPPTRPGGAILLAAPEPAPRPDPRLARHKTLNYWSNRLALDAAVAAGADEMAWPDREPGTYREGTRTNLFAVVDGRLQTPGLDAPHPARNHAASRPPHGVLDGDSRDRSAHQCDLRRAVPDQLGASDHPRPPLPRSRRAGPRPLDEPAHRGHPAQAGSRRNPPMTRVAEILDWLDAFAPPALAESWDNVGLLLGDRAATVDRVMTCLTVTTTTAAEAIDAGAGLIVSHHPILFRSVKRLVASGPDAPVLALAKAGVAVFSPHTSFDNCPGGINDGLAELLDLRDVAPLRPFPSPRQFKVVVFTTEADREAVLSAAFQNGAGTIGDYRECSFGLLGTGTFHGQPGTHPAVGQPGRREEVSEWRLEFVCPADRLPQVLGAIRQAHSYEEPAIDVLPMEPLDAKTGGAGRVGRLPMPLPLAELAALVSQRLDAPALQFAGNPGSSVETLAIACGAGDDFLPDAQAQADALLTGEARYHRALDAERTGVGLILAGHHATERPGVERLAERLASAFPDVRVWASRHERDPLQSLRKSEAIP